MHLTAVDKKKVSKASISLPRTLDLFTYNSNCISLEEFRKNSFGRLIDTRAYPSLNTIPDLPRAFSQSTPALQQHISLGGTTVHLILNQETFAAPLDIIFNSHLNYRKARLVERVDGWLDQITSPITIEPEFSEFSSDLALDEEVWDLIERSARQRKSPLRQMPDMSTEANDTSVRGSNSTRPSGSYSHPGENYTRSTINPIKDHPGTAARRPKSMPSGSQLPSCWNDEMDGFICHMEAQTEFSIKSIARALKQRFAELREVSISLFSFQLRCFLLTYLVRDPGRCHPTSHRHS